MADRFLATIVVDAGVSVVVDVTVVCQRHRRLSASPSSRDYLDTTKYGVTMTF